MIPVDAATAAGVLVSSAPGHALVEVGGVEEHVDRGPVPPEPGLPVSLQEGDLVVSPVVDRHDVRVAEGCCRAGFRPEAPQELGVTGQGVPAARGVAAVEEVPQL